MQLALGLTPEGVIRKYLLPAPCHYEGACRRIMTAGRANDYPGRSPCNPAKSREK